MQLRSWHCTAPEIHTVLGQLLTAEQLLQVLPCPGWLICGLGCSRGDAPDWHLVLQQGMTSRGQSCPAPVDPALLCPSTAWRDPPTARRVNGKGLCFKTL